VEWLDQFFDYYHEAFNKGKPILFTSKEKANAFIDVYNKRYEKERYLNEEYDKESMFKIMLEMMNELFKEYDKLQPKDTSSLKPIVKMEDLYELIKPK